MSLTDSHAHLVTPDTQRYPPAPIGGHPLDPGALDNHLTAEALLAAMDRTGVARAVVVQRAHVYGYDNAYVIDAGERYSARLAAVCCIDGGAHDAGATARALAQHRGAAGLRFTSPAGTQGTAWFAGESATAIWAAAAETGASLCVHFFRWNRDEGVAALAPLLERFAGVDVVLDHAGNCAVEEPDFGLDAITALERFERLVVKLSPINFLQLAKAQLEPGAFVARVIARFGANRVMWGSDVAQTRGSYDDFVAQAQAVGAALSAADRAAFLGETAERVYFSPRRMYSIL